MFFIINYVILYDLPPFSVGCWAVNVGYYWWLFVIAWSTVGLWTLAIVGDCLLVLGELLGYEMGYEPKIVDSISQRTPTSYKIEVIDWFGDKNCVNSSNLMPRLLNFLRNPTTHFRMFLYLVTCFLKVTVSLLCRLQAVSKIHVPIHHYLLLLFIKRSAVQGWERVIYPYKSEDPSPTIPTYRQEEEKGNIVEDYNRDRAA